MTHQPPLSERARPLLLENVVGQSHLVGKNGVITKAIVNNAIPSMILWGPPGVGKTTIAQLIAQQIKRDFYQLSAISSGVKEIREVIEKSISKAGSVLFVDEIHRFNKGQQDALLGAVEKGYILLIGATTENPSFEVNSALLSRCQVFILNPLSEVDLLQVLNMAISKDPIVSHREVVLKETDALLRYSGGDARRLLNLFELAIGLFDGNNPILTDALVEEAAQHKAALYDKKGDMHYGIISAFIKSMRGSDPNAAVYWLARMIEGGEEVSFIARRMIIFASEDIGLSNANALLLANATFDAVNKIGYPESRIILSQCAIYLATSPKSNSAYVAISDAIASVNQHGDLPVPLHLLNAPTGLMKNLGYGKEYQYPHLSENNFINQEYMPDALVGKVLYSPGNNQREQEIKKSLQERWKGKYGY